MGDWSERGSAAAARGFVLLEILAVVLIVGVLAAVGGGAYQDYVHRATVSEALTHLSVVRENVAEVYAHRGVLPMDNASAGLLLPDAHKSLYVDAVELRPGAVDLYLRDGHVLTVFFSVNPDNPRGPLQWSACIEFQSLDCGALREGYAILPSQLRPSSFR